MPRKRDPNDEVDRFAAEVGDSLGVWERTQTALASLASPYSAKVLSLSPADLLLVTACEKIRNAIVHRSQSSVDEMNTALVVLDPTSDADLLRTSKVTATGIAAYLHARPLPVSAQRAEVWHRRLRDVASRLRI